jgi:hypothetical protein
VDYLSSHKYRIVPLEPVTTTELVGMFGSHRVEVRRVDGKVVRDKQFNMELAAAKDVLNTPMWNDIVRHSVDDGNYKEKATYNVSKIEIGCQTVPFSDALELAQKFIKIAEGK